MIKSLIGLMTLFGAYTVHDGKLVNSSDVATMSVQEHYSAAVDAFQRQDWNEVVRQTNLVIVNFPDTPFFQESLYYLGAGYYQLGDFDLANKYLSRYLRKQAALQHFREAIQLKFFIAEEFKDGAKRHLAGLELMPKWLPAKEEALKIYDEVISALPNDDLAARALFGKASLQLSDEEYSASIETYQTLIRRFPKHYLSPDSYMQIAQVYLTECQEKYPDSDFLDLSEINLRKFKLDFPGDERIAKVESIFFEMQEVYASSFYEIAQFFERTKKPHASILYYSKIIKAYPNSKSAQKSKKRLEVLQPASATSFINSSGIRSATALPYRSSSSAIEPLAMASSVGPLRSDLALPRSTEFCDEFVKKVVAAS
jgi:outer membrane protein assembly factor BamD (BamD/ComL family)